MTQCACTFSRTHFLPDFSFAPPASLPRRFSRSSFPLLTQRPPPPPCCRFLVRLLNPFPLHVLACLSSSSERNTKKKKEVSCRCSGRTFYFFFLIFASCLTFLPFFRLPLFCSCFHFYYCVVFLLYIRVSRYLQCSSARFFFFFFHASARRASFSFKHLLTFLSIYCLLVLFFFFSIRLLTYRNTPKNGL